ncbi:MAG: class I SAM-dependent methyltransferase [Solirubrobacterales bacterium]|nr:class I SAM-dependent methyltransferase [Solirubrobacterales bacterium]
MSDRQEIARRHHPELDFGGFSDIDGTVRFYLRVQELLAPDAVALDIGCGRGAQIEDDVRVRRDLRVLRGRCARVIGIDVDPAAATNQFVDEFRMIGQDLRWPVDDTSVDLAVADFVVEHIAEPDHFFSEAARVIRPGGVLCIRTVNANSYLGLASRLVPARLHARVLGRLQPRRHAEDVFPTVYRANTVKTLRGLLERHGFDAAVYGAEAEPAYLGFSALTYALGLAHGRLAPSRLRVGLFAWGRRR